MYIELLELIKSVAHCWRHFLHDCWSAVSGWFMISCSYLFVSTWICVKSLYRESHKSPRAAYDCWSFADFFLLSVRSKIKGTRKNHLILFALNWNSESTISCSHFPKVIANWCELLNSLHLTAAQAAQNDLTLNSSLIFGMCKSPWLFLIISWLRILIWPSCKVCSSDSRTVALRCCCCCDDSCRLFVFGLAVNVSLKCCSFSSLPPHWCYRAQ